MSQTISSPTTHTPNPIPRGSLLSLPGQLVQIGMRDWRLPAAAITALLLLPFLVAGSGVVAALLGKPTYKAFTGEDGLAETLQVVFYSLALLLSLAVVFCHAKAGRRTMAVLYVLLTCGFIFLVGEEISWGQRIFGWSTPQTLQEINKQAETNLHNVHGVGKTFKWIQLLVGAYGTILPLVLLWPGVLKRFRPFLSAVVPHITLVPYFLLLFVWRVYRNGFEAPPRYYFVVAEYNEVMELILSIGFFLFLIFQLRTMASFATTKSPTPATQPAA